MHHKSRDLSRNPRIPNRDVRAKPQGRPRELVHHVFKHSQSGITTRLHMPHFLKFGKPIPIIPGITPILSSTYFSGNYSGTSCVQMHCSEEKAPPTTAADKGQTGKSCLHTSAQRGSFDRDASNFAITKKHYFCMCQ